MNFSNEQKLAISHLKGPALVLAGPGSGKTRVIIQRLFNLLETNPDAKILSLTFSRAAATEMKQRFDCLATKKYSNVHFSTIHSLSFSILKKGWSSSVLPELVTAQKNKIIKNIYYKTNKNVPSLSDIDTLVSAISRYRNNKDTFNPYSVQIKNFIKICDAYDNYKKENNLIDYDDMIFYANDILKNNPAAKKYWSGKYNFIQVDEAQDLTSSQFEVIDHIAPSNNIFIVADDDQSIYGFRGARPACLFDFTEKTSDCTKYYLSNNYRCARKIVSFSVKLIANNHSRFEKSPMAIKNQDGKIEILHARNPYSQGKFICHTIAENIHSITFGILYRNNRNALSIVVALIHYDIAFKISCNDFPISKKHIDMFLCECIKNQCRTEKPLSMFHRILSNGFRKKCTSKKELTEQEADTINATLDFLQTICGFANSHEDICTLIQKTEDVFMCGLYNGTAFSNKQIFLSTIHSAKGLEYDSVFVIDINKDQFPGKSSISGTLLDEERRLFYVAVTRAKDELYLMYSENYGMVAQEESIFIQEARKALKGV